MTAEYILYIIVAAVLAFAISVFMYGYKVKYRNSLRVIFGLLRFGVLWALFILIINPKFESISTHLVKPKLSVLVDESSSMLALSDSSLLVSAVDQLKNHQELNDKFDVSFFSFGSDFRRADTLIFSDAQSRIDEALNASSELFKNEVAPTILLSDGNQTLGRDYEFSSLHFPNKIYPLMVGDSTRYLDLKIEQLNTNRYSFLKNEFPVEAILVYDGEEPITSRFTIRRSNQEVYATTLSFSDINNSQILSINLPAVAVGLQRYTATIEPISDEKNTSNNRRNFAVEVIDQATNVLFVSDGVHPDMGALKKAIESNEQRKVTFMKPAQAATGINDYQLVLLYQPSRNFASVFTELEKLQKNYLLVTGTQTDWNFLNNTQKIFRKEAVNVTEAVQGQLNNSYSNYSIEELDWSRFPPLETSFGDLGLSVPYEVLLSQEINGITTGKPMLSTTDINGRKISLWDGEGLWQWRAHSFLEYQSFQPFDEFVGSLVQYLASNKRRSRLEVSFESFYYSNNPIKVSAQYFDKNFVFDNRAQLEITAKNKDSEEKRVFPMLIKNNYYEVDLNSLAPGDYDFTISVKDEAVARSGTFTILDFDVEAQFLNGNVTKLQRIATHTEGKAYFLKDENKLIDSLVSDESLRPIEKSQRKVVPLIDWKYLLALISFLLSTEWFIRKYNGLI